MEGTPNKTKESASSSSNDGEIVSKIETLITEAQGIVFQMSVQQCLTNDVNAKKFFTNIGNTLRDIQLALKNHPLMTVKIIESLMHYIVNNGYKDTHKRKSEKFEWSQLLDSITPQFLSQIINKETSTDEADNGLEKIIQLLGEMGVEIQKTKRYKYALPIQIATAMEWILHKRNNEGLLNFTNKTVRYRPKKSIPGFSGGEAWRKNFFDLVIGRLSELENNLRLKNKEQKKSRIQNYYVLLSVRDFIGTIEAELQKCPFDEYYLKSQDSEEETYFKSMTFQEVGKYIIGLLKEIEMHFALEERMLLQKQINDKIQQACCFKSIYEKSISQFGEILPNIGNMTSLLLYDAGKMIRYRELWDEFKCLERLQVPGKNYGIPSNYTSAGKEFYHSVYYQYKGEDQAVNQFFYINDSTIVDIYGQYMQWVYQISLNMGTNFNTWRECYSHLSDRVELCLSDDVVPDLNNIKRFKAYIKNNLLFTSVFGIKSSHYWYVISDFLNLNISVLVLTQYLTHYQQKLDELIKAQYPFDPDEKYQIDSEEKVGYYLNNAAYWEKAPDGSLRLKSNPAFIQAAHANLDSQTFDTVLDIIRDKIDQEYKLYMQLYTGFEKNMNRHLRLCIFLRAIIEASEEILCEGNSLQLYLKLSHDKLTKYNNIYQRVQQSLQAIETKVVDNKNHINILIKQAQNQYHSERAVARYYIGKKQTRFHIS